jgi:hypothetical protein
LTQPVDTPARPAAPFAKLVTEVLAPWVWVFSLPFAVAANATGELVATVLWGLVVGVTGSAIPMVVIVRGARKGQWDSHHVTNRADRLVPFIACLVALVSWSRVRLGDHTVSKIIGGLAVGSLIGGLLYWMLMSALL